MKRVLLVAITFLAGAVLAGAGEVARLVAYSGAVDVVRLGAGVVVYPDFPLLDGDTVKTRDGSAVVRFPDKTELRLRPSTQVRISERKESRDIDLLVGRLWSFIARSKDRPTNFRSGGTIAAVRGTQIELLRNEDGSCEIGVNDGKVTLILPDGTEITLLAGFHIAIGADGKPGPIEPHVQGEIAAIGGTVEEVPEGVPVHLTRVLGVEGNNPFDPVDPAAGGATPLPTPSATPTPGPTEPPDGGPTPPPEPGEQPRPPCSGVARAACASNVECCRPYQCFRGECCKVVTSLCSPGPRPASDCCGGAICALNEERGRYNCCFEQRHQCDSDSECCSGVCNAGRCGPTPVTCGRVDERCNPSMFAAAQPVRARPSGKGRSGGASRKRAAGAGEVVVTDPTLPECCPGLSCQFTDVGALCLPCGGSGEACCGDYFSGTCASGLDCCFGQCLTPLDCSER